MLTVDNEYSLSEEELQRIILNCDSTARMLGFEEIDEQSFLKMMNWCLKTRHMDNVLELILAGDVGLSIDSEADDIEFVPLEPEEAMILKNRYVALQLAHMDLE